MYLKSVFLVLDSRAGKWRCWCCNRISNSRARNRRVLCELRFPT